MIKRSLLKIPTFIFLIVFLLSCRNSNKPLPPKTASNALDELVQSAPFQYLNLDNIKTRLITLQKDDIIYSISKDISNHETKFGHFTRFEKIGDQFLVYDGVVNSIYSIDLSGNVNGPFTREGRGPGEHGNVGNLKANNKFIYVSDEVNARINVYNHKFNPIGQIDSLSNFLDTNNTIFAMHNKNSTGFAPINSQEGLITLSFIDNVSDTFSTILPRIVPEHTHPQIYNISRASINDKNTILANYYFLPWFIIYHNSIHIQTLIIKYSKFDKMNIPRFEIFKQLGNQGFGGVKPITEYKLMDNGDIFFSIRTELFHLTKSSDNFSYKLVGKYQFLSPKSLKLLWIVDIFQSKKEDEFLVGSWEYLFRIDVSD